MPGWHPPCGGVPSAERAVSRIRIATWHIRRRTLAFATRLGPRRPPRRIRAWVHGQPPRPTPTAALTVTAGTGVCCASRASECRRAGRARGPTLIRGGPISAWPAPAPACGGAPSAPATCGGALLAFAVRGHPVSRAGRRVPDLHRDAADLASWAARRWQPPQPAPALARAAAALTGGHHHPPRISGFGVPPRRPCSHADGRRAVTSVAPPLPWPAPAPACGGTLSAPATCGVAPLAPAVRRCPVGRAGRRVPDSHRDAADLATDAGFRRASWAVRATATPALVGPRLACTSGANRHARPQPRPAWRHLCPGSGYRHPPRISGLGVSPRRQRSFPTACFPDSHRDAADLATDAGFRRASWAA